MDTLWIILLSAATPIAGIVGFAIQLRTIKKTRLENEKLSLEIQKLKLEKEISERKLIIPTTQEVIDYNVRYSVRGNGNTTYRQPPKAPLSEKLLLFFILALAIIFFAYLVFDLYRLYEWLRSYFNF